MLEAWIDPATCSPCNRLQREIVITDSTIPGAGDDFERLSGASRSRSRLNHKLLSVAIAIVLIVLGTSLGWQIAKQLDHGQIEQELTETAWRVSARIDEILVETIQIFDDLEKLELVSCSDELLLEMRTHLFEARFIQDIGGFERGSLFCSTALGRLDEPYTSGPPDLMLDNGIGIRTDRSVLASDQMRTMVLEREPFNALIDIRTITDMVVSLSSGEIFLGYPGQDRWHPFQVSGQKFVEQVTNPGKVHIPAHREHSIRSNVNT